MKRLALLAFVLAFAAGCGGDGGGGGGGELSKSEYQEKVQAVGETLSKSIDDLGSAVSGSGNLEEAASQIQTLQDALNGAADDLAALDAPSDVDSAHDKLVEGIHGFADSLGDLESAMADGNLEEIQEFQTDFAESDAVKKISDATEELGEKGYKIG